ncbi:hypothetical protein GCM10007938_05060 [Vibrio zhanjiangensis]|uniref:Uncharacterized protein n=1 Tax=Vibrio zhanjiangensis TaxID=1046128 RepID=A0ABQ6EW36_9VIBR|nr:hypothetical protein GCM10007938_05060 [Vibrio zhanjiangensis]
MSQISAPKTKKPESDVSIEIRSYKPLNRNVQLYGSIHHAGHLRVPRALLKFVYDTWVTTYHFKTVGQPS